MTNREKQFLLIILLLLFSNSILLFNYYKVSQKENNKKSLIWKSSTTNDFGSEVISYDGSHPNTQEQGAWYKSVKERIEKVFLK